jgi:hypothetical protein
MFCGFVKIFGHLLGSCPLLAFSYFDCDIGPWLDPGQLYLGRIY